MSFCLIRQIVLNCSEMFIEKEFLGFPKEKNALAAKFVQ